MTRYDAVNYHQPTGWRRTRPTANRSPVKGTRRFRRKARHRARTARNPKRISARKSTVSILTKKSGNRRSGSAHRTGSRRLSAAFRCCAADAKTIRFSWGIPGVGKTAIAEGLAQKDRTMVKRSGRALAETRRSTRWTWARSWLARATAATFEERLKAVMKELEAAPQRQSCSSTKSTL